MIGEELVMKQYHSVLSDGSKAIIKATKDFFGDQLKNGMCFFHVMHNVKKNYKVTRILSNIINEKY